MFSNVTICGFKGSITMVRNTARIGITSGILQEL
jgi:hypothetical protein